MERMGAIIRRYGLGRLPVEQILQRSIGVERQEARGERFLVANNDAVDEARRREANSVDLLVTSIPFANHYEYTASYNAFGHTDTHDHIWAQMDFLTSELLRLMSPGRHASIHWQAGSLIAGGTGE